MNDFTVEAKPSAGDNRAAGIAIVKWECPNCGQRLGDVMGDRVVIKVTGRMISVPLRDGIDQTCWKCGAYSELRML